MDNGKDVAVWMLLRAPEASLGKVGGGEVKEVASTAMEPILWDAGGICCVFYEPVNHS